MRTRNPRPLDFAFLQMNPNAIEFWFAACVDLPPNPRQAWEIALGRYNNACSLAKLYPFQSSLSNYGIFSYLKKRRSHFIRFLEITKLLDELKVVRLISREAKAYPYGFEITISAQARVTDPTFVQRLLRFRSGYRFQYRNRLNKYLLKLDPGLTVFVYNDMIRARDLWHIGYTIKCPIAPNYASHISDKNNFILEMWKSLSASTRARRVDKLRYI